MNEEKVIIEYQDKLREKEVKKFKEGTTNYYVLCYIDKLEQENQQLKKQISDLECLVESIKLGVTLNKKQEKLLDKILFRSEK